MSNYEADLFEATIQTEVEKRVSGELTRRLNDPEFMQGFVLQLLRERQQAAPALERYKKWLNTDGFLDVGQVADAIEVDYTAPDGRVRRMGRNHLIKILEIDHIILRTAGGFRLHSRYRQQLEGKAVVKATSRNDRTVTSVLFTPEGLDWLDARYSADDRTWRSTTEHEVYCD